MSQGCGRGRDHGRGRGRGRRMYDDATESTPEPGTLNGGRRRRRRRRGAPTMDIMDKDDGAAAEPESTMILRPGRRANNRSYSMRGGHGMGHGGRGM